MKKILCSFNEWVCKSSLLARALPFMMSLVGFCIWYLSSSMIGSFGGGLFYGLILAFIIGLQGRKGFVGTILSVLLMMGAIALGVFLNGWKVALYSQATFTSNHDFVALITSVALAML